MDRDVVPWGLVSWLLGLVLTSSRTGIPIQIQGPEGNDCKDLELAEFDRRSPEDVVYTPD